MYDSLSADLQFPVASKEDGVLSDWNMEGADDQPQVTQRNARYLLCLMPVFGKEIQKLSQYVYIIVCLEETGAMTN